MSPAAAGGSGPDRRDGQIGVVVFADVANALRENISSTQAK